MKDLIDRLNANPTDTIYRNDAVDALAYFDERSPTGKTAQDIIIGLPSVQPEIVRCKDCMHYGTYYRGNESKPVITYLCKWCLDRTMEPDDFCSRAERRTNDSISD